MEISLFQDYIRCTFSPEAGVWFNARLFLICANLHEKMGKIERIRKFYLTTIILEMHLVSPKQFNNIVERFANEYVYDYG